MSGPGSVTTGGGSGASVARASNTPRERAQASARRHRGSIPVRRNDATHPAARQPAANHLRRALRRSRAARLNESHTWRRARRRGRRSRRGARRIRACGIGPRKPNRQTAKAVGLGAPPGSANGSDVNARTRSAGTISNVQAGNTAAGTSNPIVTSGGSAASSASTSAHSKAARSARHRRSSGLMRAQKPRQRGADHLDTRIRRGMSVQVLLHQSERSRLRRSTARRRNSSRNASSCRVQ